MTRCILHIGMHKTGSTSIQESLSGFSDDRFCYAKLDTSNHSLAVFSLFAPNPGRHRLHQDARPDAPALAAYIADMRARLERSVEKAGHRTLIVSGEDMSVQPSEVLARIRDWFKARFDEVVVVGYVRPPAAFMSSGFQQRVKSGGVRRGFHLQSEYREYRKRFGVIDTVFGRESVQLWKFDPAAFPGGCVVRDFCSRMGIELPARRIVRLNESLPKHVVAQLYTYARLGEQLGFAPMSPAEGEKLSQMLAAGRGERFRFSPDVVKPVLAANREDIAWMEARLGQPLDENLVPQPGDVRGEADLLTPDRDAVAQLVRQLGRAAPAGLASTTSPEDVARLVHALREKHTPAAKRASLRTAAGREGKS